MQEYNRILELLVQPIKYSDREKREIEKAHFTEEMLLDILKSPKVLDEKKIFIESFSYNQVPFVF